MDMLLSIAQLPRSTFYYHLKGMKQADKYEMEKAKTTAIFHENKGRYEYRRITIALRSRGICLNNKTVQRLMKESGRICRVRMKKYCSHKGEIGKIAPNLLNRDFFAEKPNQKWVLRQNWRACRLRFTDNKPFLLLEQFLVQNIV